MNRTSNLAQAALTAPLKRYSSLTTLAKSTLVTVAVVGVFGGAGYFYSGDGFWGAQQAGDSVSDAQRLDRISGFEAIGTMNLVVVPETDIPRAVESMGLPASAKQALEANLSANQDSTSLPSSEPSQPAPKPAVDSVVTGATSAQTNASTAQAAPRAARVASSPTALPNQRPPVRLAWVTLWDTDAEDGDAIRIESQGYSRTVVLRKQPVTLAIPVPGDGHVNIVGIRDGEGGGITVGLASGAAKAVLPIMSVGQVLSLKVKVN